MPKNHFYENSVNVATASLKSLTSTPPMKQAQHEAIRKSQVANRRRAEDLRLERAMNGDFASM